MDLFLPQKDKGGNGDDPGTPGSSPGTPGSGAGTPDGSPGTPGSGTGTPDGSPGTPNGGTGTPGSSPGTPRGGHGWPLGSGWFDWLPDSWWTIDPLVIEFSKGTKSGTNSHTHFDFDGDGFAEYTEWISDTQGLLVWDRNQNGVIDDGKELFGDYSVLNSGKNSKDGFEALADFDTNGDGCVDASDDGWSKLRVWMDNGDGFFQKNELKTLDELGIKKLNVSANNIVDHQSDYINADGTKGKMKDYFFRTSRTDTLDKNQVAVSDEVKQLFYLPGSGTMQDSWQVAMKDETGSFAALLKSYEYATTQEEKSTILDHILYAMAGADKTVNPRASHIDEKKFTVLEKVYGIQFKRSNSWNGPVYERIYGDVKRYYEGYLSAQTNCREILSSIQLVYDEKNGNLSIDFSSVAAKLKEKLSSDHEAGVQLVVDFANAMKSLEYDRLIGYQEFCQEMTTEDDALFNAFYSAGRVVVEGGKDADRLIGMGGSELLLGKDGNDTLTAHGVDDVLIGGKGDDMLYGERGDSTNCWGKMAGNGTVTYVWNVGDGNDKICNVSDFERAKSSTGTAYIRFGNHVTQENISFTRSNDDIKITYQPTGESITIQGWFKHDAYKLDGICFADGTFIGKEELYEKALDFHATAGDDSLIGSSQDDTMSGGKGNDKLYGNNGSDILDGGEGNDYLEGGYGDDTYIWKAGDGNDTVHNAIHNFWQGYIDAGNDTLKIQDVRPEDIRWRVQRNDLQAVNQKTGETLKLEGWYADKKNRVDQIIFDDGTVLKDDEVDKLAQISRGTDGDDTLQGGDTMDDIQLGGKGNDKLYGNNGSDILDGGEGNDYLEGGYGDDTYIWKTGDGNDTIHNAIHNFWQGYIDAGNDTMIFADGIFSKDIVWSSEKENVLAKDIQTGEEITFAGWNEDKKNRVDQIIFSDGSVFQADQIDQCIQKMNQASLEFYTPVGEMDISHTLSKTENHLVIASTAAEKQKAS